MKYLAVLLIAASSVTHADAIRLGGFSHHWSNPSDDSIYNEKHPAFIYENDEYGVAAGYLVNSFDDDTFSVVKQWTISQDRDVDLKLNLGVVYGYRDCMFNSGTGTRRFCVWFPPELRLKNVPLQPSLVWLGNGAAITFGHKF